MLDVGDFIPRAVPTHKLADRHLQRCCQLAVARDPTRAEMFGLLMASRWTCALLLPGPAVSLAADDISVDQILRYRNLT